MLGAPAVSQRAAANPQGPDLATLYSGCFADIYGEIEQPVINTALTLNNEIIQSKAQTEHFKIELLSLNIRKREREEEGDGGTEERERGMDGK